VGLLDACSSGAAFTGSFGRQSLAGDFATRAFSGGLLGAGHGISNVSDSSSDNTATRVALLYGGTLMFAGEVAKHCKRIFDAHSSES
jgi:hypothetical protein